MSLQQTPEPTSAREPRRFIINLATGPYEGEVVSFLAMARLGDVFLGEVRYNVGARKWFTPERPDLLFDHPDLVAEDLAARAGAEPSSN